MLTAEAVRVNVHGLLEDPSYREAARRLQDEISAMPAPAEAVPALERLASGRL